MSMMAFYRLTAAIAALLAACPLSAQMRVKPAGETGNGVLAGGVSASLSAPAPVHAPILAPALTVPALQATVASAARPAAVAVISDRGEVRALSAERVGSISGETAKALSGRLFDLENGRPEAALISGRFAASTPDLKPLVDRGPAPKAPEPARPSRRAPATLADHLHHVRLLAQNYYWYSVTHIVNMWPVYHKQWSEAKARGEANVSHPRAFFAYMRIAGVNGRFYVLGSAPSEDDVVIANLRRTFLTWYDAPGAIGPKELEAFDAFTDRARAYNAERRAPSNMRKHIRDALIRGSVIAPSKLAEFFDSLLLEETSRKTANFQNKGIQKRILDAFTKEALDTLAEEPEGVRGRVRAIILLGSFATGSAGPKSDFDVEVLTDGGSNARTPAFIKRLTDRWIATGHHARNPVTVHDFPSTPTRGIIDLIHTNDFILISNEQQLVESLQRKPGEYTPRLIRSHSLRGHVNRAVQFAIIVGSTYVGDLKARLGAAPAGH